MLVEFVFACLRNGYSPAVQCEYLQPVSSKTDRSISGESLSSFSLDDMYLLVRSFDLVRGGIG